MSIRYNILYILLALYRTTANKPKATGHLKSRRFCALYLRWIRAFFLPGIFFGLIRYYCCWYCSVFYSRLDFLIFLRLPVHSRSMYSVLSVIAKGEKPGVYAVKYRYLSYSPEIFVGRVSNFMSVYLLRTTEYLFTVVQYSSPYWHLEKIPPEIELCHLKICQNLLRQRKS